jgi:membrane protease YdiL (CAAX protease family)
MVAGSTHAPAYPQSRLAGWGNVLVITLLGCLLFGVVCFVVLGDYLRTYLDLFHAAVVLQLSFAAAAALVLAWVVAWQQSRGQSLADVGLGKPTTTLALVLAVLLGVLYLTGSYFGARLVLPRVNVLAFNWVRVALAPLGVLMAVAEETLMRGFFMTELQRARVATWLQIVASGACSALYHALHNPTPLGYFPSFVLFSLHAGLYVLGRRSLTPVILAHSIYHVFGEPYLIMMLLAA